MRTTWKPLSNETKLTFLLALTFLFLFSGSSVVFASAPGPQGYPPDMGIFGLIIFIIVLVFFNYPQPDEPEEWKPTPDLDKPELIDFEQHADEDDEDDDYDPRRDGCKIF